MTLPDRRFRPFKPEAILVLRNQLLPIGSSGPPIPT
jgi:hypothetical protein